MKIVVFGAGAVGGHVACRLGAGAARAGIEVAAVARGVQLAANRRSTSPGSIPGTPNEPPGMNSQSSSRASGAATAVTSRT